MLVESRLSSGAAPVCYGTPGNLCMVGKLGKRAEEAEEGFGLWLCCVVVLALIKTGFASRFCVLWQYLCLGGGITAASFHRQSWTPEQLILMEVSPRSPCPCIPPWANYLCVNRMSWNLWLCSGTWSCSSHEVSESALLWEGQNWKLNLRGKKAQLRSKGTVKPRPMHTLGCIFPIK